MEEVFAEFSPILIYLHMQFDIVVAQSVGILRMRTQAMEFSLVLVYAV
jgi:hypothetical protein